MKEKCMTVRVGKEIPDTQWWNDTIKSAVERKEAVYKNVLGGRREIIKERCI